MMAMIRRVYTPILVLTTLIVSTIPTFTTSARMAPFPAAALLTGRTGSQRLAHLSKQIAPAPTFHRQKRSTHVDARLPVRTVDSGLGDDQSCGYIQDCDFTSTGPWRWQAPASISYGSGPASPGYLHQNDTPGDCCRARFGQDVTVPNGAYVFQLISDTQPSGPCTSNGDDAAFAYSLDQNVNCTDSLQWERSPAPPGSAAGYSTWTSTPLYKSGQFYFEFFSTGGTYTHIGLYPLDAFKGSTSERACGFIQDCNFATVGPWHLQEADIIVPAEKWTHGIQKGFLAQKGGANDCCRSSFGQNVTVPADTYAFQLVSDQQPIGPCFIDSGATNCEGTLSWVASPAPLGYPDGYNMWTSSSFERSGTFSFAFSGSGGHYHTIGLYGLKSLPSTAEVMCGCNSTEYTTTRSFTRHPINAATGDFYHTFTDIAIPGRGIPLRTTRTYNSLLALQDGPFGYGWSSDIGGNLVTDASGVITVTENTGTVVTFDHTVAGYEPPSRVMATLRDNGNATLAFTDIRTQTTFVYTTPTTTTTGQLVRMIDRNGYVTILGYSGGQLTSVTDPAHRSLTFTYSGTHISQISDPIGRTVVYTYSTAGDLTAVRDVSGGITRFSYYPNTHLMRTMTDPGGGTIVNTYDGDGSRRVISQTDALNRTTAFTYTGGPLDAQTIITDPVGHVTLEQYMGNELMAHTEGYGTSQQATWSYTYDPTTLGVTSEADPNGHTSYNTWDSAGNLLSHIDALGRTTSYAYDALNDTTAITDPLGVVTRMTYDAHGNLLSTSRSLVATAVPSATATSAGTGAPTSAPISADSGTPTPTSTPQSAVVAASEGVVWEDLSLSPPMIASACGGFTATPPCATGVHGLSACAGRCDPTISATGDRARPVRGDTLGVLSTLQGQSVSGLLDNPASWRARTPTPVPSRARLGSRRVGTTRGAPSCPRSPAHCATATPHRPVPSSTRDVRRAMVISIDDSVQGHGVDRFQYVGRWTHCKPCRDGVRIGMYDRSSSVSRRSGNYYTLTFRGTGIALYSVHGPTHGIEEITLDGHSRTLIDLYSRRRTGDVLDHRYAHLVDAVHVLTVRVTGRKNRKSGDIYVVADRVAITQARSTPPRQTPTPPPATATRMATRIPTFIPTTTSRSTATPLPIIMAPTTTATPMPPTPMAIATPTPTATPTMAAPTATGTQAATDTPPATPVPPTSTTTATPSATAAVPMIPATSTPTNTAPTAPPSATVTGTPAGGATPPPGTASATTDTPSAPTATASLTATASPTATSTQTSAPSPTVPPTATPTPLPSIPCTDAGPYTATVCLTYDPAHPGDVIARTDPDGHTAYYTHDQYGNLTSASDPLSDTTTYQYDLIGRKTAMVRPLGNVPGANPISYTTTMSYNAFGEMTAITDALGNVTTYQYDPNQNLITTTDALGRQAINGYDAVNERTSVTRPDGGIISTGYDPAGNVMTTTDALAHGTTYGYDTLNRPISMTDPLGRTTLTGYDLAGNVITSTDALGHSTIYAYDDANERTSVIRADGGIYRTGYDLAGQVITSTDALGNLTQYNYDSLHRRVGVTVPLQRTTLTSYDLAGNVITTTDPLRHGVMTMYDAANRPVLVTRPDGSQTHTEYDADGNVTAIIDPLGHTTRYGYDALDRRVAMTDALGHTTVYRYDAVGNHTATTDPLLHTTTMAYDNLNRVITITDPLSRTTIDRYDLAGNVVTQIDALGHTTINGYDAANERTSVTQSDGSVLRTGYDNAGNVITSTDALSRTTTYGYDAVDRVVTTTAPLARTTIYSYDLDGNRTALVDAMGRTTFYGFDAANETIAITYSDGTTPNVAYTYYAEGQRQSMTDGTGATTYQYNALDRVITTTTGSGATLGYGYDRAGNLTTLTYPDSSVITRTYDAANRFVGLTDPLGHTTQFAYDAANNLTMTTYPNGAAAVMSYNAADQLTGITDSVRGSPEWTYNYGRDALGQVSSVSDTMEGASHAYTYTPINQLAGDARTGITTAATMWSTNSAYDITQRVDPTGPATSTLTYDAAHELTNLQVVSRTAVSKNLTWSYNADGDRIGQADAVSGDSLTYGYDQADRLITASVEQAHYAYDGDGLRASKSISGTTIQETWDTVEGLPLLVQDGGTRYLTGPDGLPIEQLSASGTPLYYEHDQLGSTRALLNEDGNVAVTYIYDAYGAVKDRTGSTTTPFGFAGQYIDVESGLQYLRARYYDPALGQFLSRDPMVDKTGQAYAYAGDNPLNAADPSGLDVNLCGLGIVIFCGSTPEQVVNNVATNAAGPAVGPAAHYIVHATGRGVVEGGLDLFNQYLYTTSFSNLAPYAPTFEDCLTGGRLAGLTGGYGADYQQGGAFQVIGRLGTNSLPAFATDGIGEVGTLGDAGANFAGALGSPTVGESRLVIGRVNDLAPETLVPSEFTLLPRLTPNLGDPQLNWIRNASELRLAMRNGLREIRDASPYFKYVPKQGGAFVNAERNLLRSRGWIYDESTSIWSAPK